MVRVEYGVRHVRRRPAEGRVEAHGSGFGRGGHVRGRDSESFQLRHDSQEHVSGADMENDETNEGSTEIKQKKTITQSRLEENKKATGW